MVDGINKANIPVLIVQGSEDPINTPDSTGIYAHRSRITNPFVEYLYITKKDCANHSSAFHTDAANEAMAAMELEIKALRDKLTGEQLEKALDDYYAKLDIDLFSAPNAAFLEQVNDFYSRALKRQ